MIKLVNYNKGATIIAARNTQIIAILCVTLVPLIFNTLNNNWFKLSEVISTYIIITLVSLGAVIYVLDFILLVFTLLSFTNIQKK